MNQSLMDKCELFPLLIISDTNACGRRLISVIFGIDNAGARQVLLEVLPGMYGALTPEIEHKQHLQHETL